VRVTARSSNSSVSEIARRHEYCILYAFSRQGKKHGRRAGPLPYLGRVPCPVVRSVAEGRQHNLETYLDEYIAAATITRDSEGPLFRTAAGKTGELTRNLMWQ
jgi:hypothetical protein